MSLINVAEKVKSPAGHCQMLTKVYSRLFVLEMRAGNADLAQSYFVKAQFWMLRRCELLGQPQREAAENLKAFSTNRCIQVVDEWDNEQTAGRGANYVREMNGDKVVRPSASTKQ
jgi:hypothetical protein